MIERTILPSPTTQPRAGASAPRELPGSRAGLSSQILQFALVVAGVALLTFVLFLYVLPNSEMNAAQARIAELKEQKAALNRTNAEVLKEIARYSDMKTLELRARKLGMGPVQNAFYLQMPNAGAETGQAAQFDVGPRGSAVHPASPGDASDLLREFRVADLKRRLEAVRSMLIELVDQTVGRLAPEVRSPW